MLIGTLQLRMKNTPTPETLHLILKSKKCWFFTEKDFIYYIYSGLVTLTAKYLGNLFTEASELDA